MLQYSPEVNIVEYRARPQKQPLVGGAKPEIKQQAFQIVDSRFFRPPLLLNGHVVA
jgi:hypothetical protein